MKIYKANILYTPTPSAFVVKRAGYVVVNTEGFIQGVYDKLPDQYHAYEVIDLGEKLLIPAMNDMHVHAPQYQNIGIAMDQELLPWLNTYIFPEESKFVDTNYAESIYRAFVKDLCRQGTMRAAVFATTHLPATKCLVDCFDKAGMGALIGLVGMDRNAPECLQNTPKSWHEGMLSLTEYLQDHPRIHTIITPRFIPSCSPDMLHEMGAMADEYALPVQSHLSENQSEIQWVKELEPLAQCYGDAYHRYGLFGQTPTLMAHCCYTEGIELELMRDNRVGVVHCPTSNCNLASGIAPIRRFLEEGVTVTLGSDVAGGHHLSIMRVMQYAVQMSKLQYALTNGKDAFLTLSEVFYMATKSGGSYFGKVGSFESGYAFDALVIDDSSLRYAYSESDNKDDLIQRLERFVYIGDDRNISKRFCQGKEIDINNL